MTAGWKNPKAPYDFTQGEWEDYKKNYSNLSQISMNTLVV